ncbi:MAG: ABC transporter permease [Desulfarculus sp.]|nr:ABC transporter permease [Desulfarculus sp.]
MAIPISYSLRNLWVRRLTTALTAGGMALVVFVFAAVLMLAKGLEETLVATGSPDNVVALRRSAQAEVQSILSPDQTAVVQTQPEIALDKEGQALVQREVVVLISLTKQGGAGPGNVVVRGTSPLSLDMRQQVRLVAGRMFRPGSDEIVAGKNIAQGFLGAGLGGSLKFAQRSWRVVGVMDAAGTGFDSEIWGDLDQLRQAFRRNLYSSVLITLRQPGLYEQLRDRLEGDPRLPLEVKREQKYYQDQSEAMARFIRILGLALTIIFSVGAILGAMITMYAAVANRTVEVGTLRALGFRRRDILLAFLAESLLLSLAGGLAGLAGASLMQLVRISTTNWATFSELAFNFSLSPSIVLQTLGFALGMGLLGGVLPAFRAARLQIVAALRGE